MSIISEYFKLQKECGEKTVILLKLGHFYEIYQYDPAHCQSQEDKLDEYGEIQNESIGHAIELSQILNCLLSFKYPNNHHSYESPFVIGFLVPAFNRYHQTLILNGFHVIAVDIINGKFVIQT